MLQLYGIPNCQTVKKARSWLDEHKIEYQFHNFKIEVPTAELLQHWLLSVSLEQLVNKRGTTWRKLNASEQQALQHISTAIAVLIAHPSVIKRPVAVSDNTASQIHLGFDPDVYQALFQA